MPQVQLHQGCFDVQIQIAGDAPADVHRLADRLLTLVGSIVAEALKALLRARLREELGPRGQPGNRFGPGQEAECPGCGSGAAYRKGFRTRTVEVRRLGALEVERPYLECKACGRSYTPYAGGVPEQRRYGREALRRPMEATLETSYRRGAEACPESPSASTLWRRVQEQSPEGSRTLAEASGVEAGVVPWATATCVADSTPIPARRASGGRKQASHSLSIAHLVESDPDGGPGGRSALQRHPVAARVGSETRLRADLRSVPIRSLITDGKMEIAGVAPFVGRCRWHLPRSIRYGLYNDDVSGDFNERLTGSLRSLVHEGFPSGAMARDLLQRWAAACDLVAPQSATTVERAIDSIAIYAERPEAFTVETTAPAEREMRELNRRFENGGQWTRPRESEIPSAENLLRWHQVYRHAPAQWTDWFDRKKPTEEPTVSQC
jgi:hypothetical protein